MSNLPSVLVVGAGIAGLSAAYRLQQAGFDVQVFEAGSAHGGRMAERREGSILYNTGARLIYPLGSELWALIDELDLRAALIPLKGLGGWCDDEEDRSYSITLFPGPRLLSLHVLNLLDKLRLLLFGAELFRVRGNMDPSRLYSALDYDNESLADFVRRKMGPRVLKYLIEPVIRATRSWNPEEVSAACFVSFTACLLGHHRAYAFVEGMGQLVSALANCLDISFGTKVISIERLPGTRQCRIVYREDGQEKICHADIVVCATEGSRVGDMVVTPTPDEETFFRSIRSNKLGVVHYLLNEEIEPLLKFYLRDRNNKISVYQQIPSTDRLGQAGARIYCQLSPEMSETAWQQGKQTQLDELIRDDVRKMYPAVDQHLSEVVNQWIEYKLPLPYPGYGRRIATFLKYQNAKKQRIYYCGDYLAQALVNGACASGVETARLIQKHWCESD